MTPEIIEMARQANATQIGHKLIAFHFFIAELEAFAKLVDEKATAREREAFAVHAVDIARRAVAQEREACAKICDSVNNYDNPMTANDVADAIRVRGDQ